MSTALLIRDPACERVEAMTRPQRQGAYERGELSLAELNAWARIYPEEVPLVNGEFPWIALSLADLD